MAKCPNCSSVVSWNASTCLNCQADFSITSNWLPIADTDEEKLQIVEKRRIEEERQVEETGQKVETIRQQAAAAEVLRTRLELRHRAAFHAVSFALWLVSLALPALIPLNPESTLWGLGILMFGWLGIAAAENSASALGALAWWANPFYLWALSKASLRGGNPEFSTFVALGIASLTVLVSGYTTSAAGTHTPVIGYGPGALLWYLAMLSLAYLVAREGGYSLTPPLLIGLAFMLCLVFTHKVVSRAVQANASERERLPPYAAKRGSICSTEATPLPISGPQPAIALEADKADSKQWLGSLRNWNIAAVQVGSTEYTRARKDSPESRKPPYMAVQPVTVPARYTLRVKGGYSGYYWELTLIDNQTKTQVGQLSFYRESNPRLGFCPALNTFPRSRNEEGVRWLAPFITNR